MITAIFVSIFEPPIINVSGLEGFDSFSERNFISCSTKRPIPFVAKCFVIPEFEAWFLWAVPKASFIYIEPCLASCEEKSELFSISSL